MVGVFGSRDNIPTLRRLRDRRQLADSWIPECSAGLLIPLGGDQHMFGIFTRVA